MRPKGSPAELERRRFWAVELLERGEPRELVARILGVDLGTLSRWHRLAREGNLKAKPAPGAPRRLSPRDYEELEILLLQGATAHGWSNELWTGSRVQQIIERHFGVTYNPPYVCQILKEHLQWSCQKPEHQRKRDDADGMELARWTAEEFARILLEAERRGAYLAFVDETGFSLEPTVRRTFAPRGQTPIHKIADQHGKISTIGALVITPGRNAIHLAYEHLPDNENYQGASVARFVRALHSEFYGPMTLLWDQTVVHGCRPVEEYLAEERGLILEPFPPYAPKLNPADGIWRYTKYQRLANYAPPNLAELRDAITVELEGLKRRPALLKSFVRFTKLPIVFAS
jgi:transposase